MLVIFRHSRKTSCRAIDGKRKMMWSVDNVLALLIVDVVLGDALIFASQTIPISEGLVGHNVGRKCKAYDRSASSSLG